MSSHLYVASVSQLTGELLTETIMHQKAPKIMHQAPQNLLPASGKISKRQNFNFEKAHYAGQLKRGKRMIKCNKLLYGRILLLWRLKKINTQHTRAIFFRRKVRRPIHGNWYIPGTDPCPRKQYRHTRHRHANSSHLIFMQGSNYH